MKTNKSNSAVVKLYSTFPVLIILSIVMVLVTIVYLNNSLGWFFQSKVDSGNGMGVKVDVSQNLVVSDDVNAIASYTISGWSNEYVEKVWNASVVELIPADHYTESEYPVVEEGTNTVGLVYNTNPENVARNTGKGEDLTFAYVPADGEDTYFIDRTVYIASLDRPMTKGVDYASIEISIAEAGEATTMNNAYKSASADVYVGGAFKGTLNLDTLESITVDDLDAIPLNTSGSIEIIFRCYFDGALEKANDPTKNYVNSTELAVNTANISMEFTVAAKQAT